jgi:WD40 repeat protein
MQKACGFGLAALVVLVGAPDHGKADESVPEKRVLVDHWPNRFDRIGAIDLKQPANAAAFSPDGKSLVTSSRDKAELVFWEPATGKRLRTVRLDTSEVFGLKFAGKGKFIMMRTETWSQQQRSSGVALWDVAASRLAWKMTMHKDKHGMPRFAADDSTDGHFLAVGDELGRLHVWDSTTGKIVRVFDAHSNSVDAIAFSFTGTQLISSAGRNEVSLWETATGRRLATRKFEKGEVDCVGFLPDGTPVADWHDSGKGQLLDVRTAAQVDKGGGREWDSLVDDLSIRARARFARNFLWPLRWEAASPDGKRTLVTVAGPCFAFLALVSQKAEESATVAGDQFDMWQSGFTADGRWAYAVITEDLARRPDKRERSLIFWDAMTGTPAGRVCPPEGVRLVTWSPDGRQAVIIGQKTAWIWPKFSLPLK